MVVRGWATLAYARSCDCVVVGWVGWGGGVSLCVKRTCVLAFSSAAWGKASSVSFCDGQAGGVGLCGG